MEQIQTSQSVSRICQDEGKRAESSALLGGPEGVRVDGDSCCRPQSHPAKQQLLLEEKSSFMSSQAPRVF